MRGPLKVSVCIVTYNQESYIAQCLQSIVDQVVDFDFEILVSDDASTDGTARIVSEFSKKYPDLIKAFLHEKNLGAGPNFVFVHDQAQGEYIAHVDGDDYCLPGKLQVQADFLDANSDCNIAWHRMLTMYPDGSLRDDEMVDEQSLARLSQRRFYRSEIIQFIAVGPNSSKMYRKKVREFDVADFDTLDYFANVEQVGAGYGGYATQKALGVYRAGIGVSLSKRTRLLLCDTFVYFSKKYPSSRLQVNTAVLTYLLADLKNRRPTWRNFFAVFLKTFHPLSLFNLLLSLQTINDLKAVK